ncbi:MULTISPECIES: hypothetical protein [Bradyrhizobium]|uniref:hypothetical protein n=1 Tax=Bradyrhizobium elkanii TaxID=29448 RepID=UPI0012BC2FEE|nr:hypothetical protein [Bradyrhizobium elkanii]
MEPVVWYFKNDRGQIELFDLMGFHPQTGELIPITREVAQVWKQQAAKVVRRVAPSPSCVMDVADRSTDTRPRKYLAAQLRNSIPPEKFAERNGWSVFLWLLGAAQ